MNLRQKALRGVAWSAAEDWSNQGLSFIVFLLLARLLEPEAFGLIALANVFLVFVQTVLRGGFEVGIIQRQKLDPEHLDTAFWTNLGLGLLLTGAGMASAGPISDLFAQRDLAPIVRYLSVDVLLGAVVGVQQAILRREFNFKALAARSFAARSLAGFVAIGMAFEGFGVWSLVGQQLVYSAVAVVVLWRVSAWRPGFNISRKHFRELFAFGVNITGTNMLVFFSTRLDHLLIGYFLGATALGFYTVAYRTLNVTMALLVSTTSKVTLPAFSRLQNDPERLERAFYRVTGWTSLVAFPVFFGMCVLAAEVVDGLFGRQWAPAIPVMQVLALAGIFQSVHYFDAHVLIAMGKPLWRLGTAFINGVANVFAFALAVQWGIVAVAAAFTIRGYFLSPFSLWLVSKVIHINLRAYVRQYTAPLVASLVMVAVVLGIRYLLTGLLNVHAFLFLNLVLGGSVYVLTLLVIAPALFHRVFETAWMVVASPLWKKP